MVEETSLDIGDRAKELLSALVEHYITSGQPVGSKTLANKTKIKISPATIRNIMANLEAEGFLHSPHASAGRIPTTKGYRLFVDSLMTVGPLTQNILDPLQIKTQLEQDTDNTNLISSASILLSDITKLAGIITLPKTKQSILRHVEFLPISQQEILVILVINKNEVQNRIIKTARSYSTIELQQAANYITKKFAGTDLRTIKKGLQTEIKQDRLHIENIVLTLTDIVDQIFQQEIKQNEDCIVAGESHLLDMLTETGIDRLRGLFEAFNRKKDILELLDNCQDADDIQIYIGEESGCETFYDCSLVTKTYKNDGRIVGVLGVIGPTRMNYNQVISAVDITSKLLSTAITF